MILNFNGMKPGIGQLPFFGGHVPRNPFKIQNENRVKHRHQEQRNKGSDGEATDLRIAERFPQRAAFQRERKQSKNRCAHGDHHRSNTLDPRVRKSTLQWLALFVHLLDEVEEHNHVADDDAD